jgi:aspartokinase-like uncharacterized kinase
MPPIAVVKVGGSLYDLPDLGPRLHRWLSLSFPRSAWERSGIRIALVPGGGPLVDAIRQLDHRHGLGEETSHWLALRALVVNAHFLAALLPSTCVIGSVDELDRAWNNELLPVLDVHEFARGDELRCDPLPHSWAVTSDALAARVAVVLRASHLVMLKSTTIPPSVDWREAGRLGLVDALFAETLRDAPADLRVQAVNLRNEPEA